MGRDVGEAERVAESGAPADPHHAPDYLHTLNTIWRGEPLDLPADSAHARVGAVTRQEAADALASDLVHLIGKLATTDPTTPDDARDSITEAHRLAEPAWAAAVRGVLGCYWMRVGEEPKAIAELVIAELELSDARERPRVPEVTITPDGEAAAGNNLGVAHTMLGYYELAEPHLRRAADISAATYRGAFLMQALVDVYNLAEFELRWAMQLLGVKRDVEAIRRSEATIEMCSQVKRLAAANADWEALADFADCLVVGARSIIDPTCVTADDAAMLARIEASDLPRGPDTDGLLLSVQARVHRLLGDPQAARIAALEVVRRVGENDLPTICGTWREAALAEGSSDTSAARYAEATAVALDVLRRRAVRDFQSRVEMARLERQHARAVETADRLQQALHSAAAEEARLLHDATHDPLTGLPNRALLTERLKNALDHAREEQRHVIVAFLDVNGLKDVNDARGHAAGDQLLMGVAEALRAVIAPQDTAARVGGDEFVVVVNSRPGEQACRAWVDQLSRTLAPPADHPPEYASLASAGVCIVTPACGLAAEDIVAVADQHMYVAKSQPASGPSVVILS